MTKLSPTLQNSTSDAMSQSSTLSDKATSPSTNDVSRSSMSDSTVASTDMQSTAEAPHDHSGIHIASGTAIGIFIIALSVVTIGSLVLYYIRTKRHLACTWCSCKICLPRRGRLSSTSSGGPLTQDDATFVNISDPMHPDRELFSIGDQDGGDDGRQSSRHRRGTEDDYFYDEIFEKSAFVDETTNRANNHLTVEDELQELNIPDLVFKKPSTRI